MEPPVANDRLLAAIRSNDLEEVAALLDAGVSLDGRDEHGWTALCSAAAIGNASLVHMLVERGADVFLTGVDERTPYLIALAAGHVDAARFLRDAEQRSGSPHAAASGARRRELGQYCRGYTLAALREFSGWQEADGDGGAETSAADDAVVFLHTDLTVCQSIWPGENVIFDRVTQEWRDFCERVLRFRPPDELELIAPMHGRS